MCKLEVSNDKEFMFSFMYASIENDEVCSKHFYACKVCYFDGRFTKNDAYDTYNSCQNHRII